METIKLSIYDIVSSANRDGFTSFFLIWMPFIYFSFLRFWIIFLVLCWIKLARLGIFVLFPILEEKFSSFSPLSMLAMGRLAKSFLFWGMFPLYPCCWEFFNETMLNFVKYFFLHLLKWSYYFNHLFYNEMYHIYWFAYVKPSLHFWNEKLDVIQLFCIVELNLLLFCWEFLYLGLYIFFIRYLGL